MEFTKPFLTFDEQADLLIERGMVASWTLPSRLTV